MGKSRAYKSFIDVNRRSTPLPHKHLMLALRATVTRSNPNLLLLILPHHRHFSNQSWLSIAGNPQIEWPKLPFHHPPPPPPPPPQQNPNPNTDSATICSLLRDPTISSGPSLELALTQTGVEPGPALLHSIFPHFDSSPKSLYTLYKWAQKHPSFTPTAPLFNSMLDLLAKAKDFDTAWVLLLDHLKDNGSNSIVSLDTFAVLIRRYARAGMESSAIRTFEFAQCLDLNYCVSVSNSNSDFLLEVLIDSLCKEGHVRVASGYCVRRRREFGWVPSVRVYNILLNGWFRSRKLKHAERLWEEMKRDNVSPTVVTYGTLVEGYCRMRRVERAMELIGEMRREGVEPNSIVYNPIVDALAEAGRFKEAMGMVERFSVLESGPTVSTYNSLVKGYCKARDLVGASKILKMMISRGFAPTPTTYNYFFRFFSQFRKIEEAMNLYTKMVEAGYVPDRLTFHLLMKMLCEEERLELAMQVSKEMRSRGFDLDLATSTMLVHLLCKLHRYDEACSEFEDMIRRGIVPQYLTYKKLTQELKKVGRVDMASRLSAQMGSLRHSTNLPNTYIEGGDGTREFKLSIMQKAQAMSDILKTSRNPRELIKMRNTSSNSEATASQLIEDIRSRIGRT